MSNISSISGVSTQGMKLFAPEPKSRVGFDFRAILEQVGGLVGQASGLGGIDSRYHDLLNKQMEMQEQLQLVSMHSNIEKSRHESKMAAIRNVRSA